MADRLAALGFRAETPDEFAQFASRLIDDAVEIGSRNGTSIRRWQDESGARLTFAIRRRAVKDVLLSFDGVPGATLRDASRIDGFLVSSAVVDENDEQVTAMALAIEEAPLIRFPFRGRVAVTALAERVVVHANADAFYASPDSTFPTEAADSPEPETDEPLAPPRAVAGFAAESFVSIGAFAAAFGSGDSTAHALLNGTVVSSERRENRVGGASFVVARVRTAGFEADVCLPSAEHPDLPGLGSIIAGEVYLVGSTPDRSVAGASSLVDRLRHFRRR